MFSPAGYDPEIDATAVAFGGADDVSTIFVMPGQQGRKHFHIPFQQIDDILLIKL